MFLRVVSGLLLALLAMLLLGGLLGQQPAKAQLTIFAASSLTDAFTELGELFASQSGVTPVFNFAASSTLASQLLQGARADIFASADEVQLERVRRADLLAGPAQLLAENRLVVITPEGSAVDTLDDLATAGLQLVLAAPEVPAGRYAHELLTHLAGVYGNDYPQRVLANVVSEEPNVRQVAAKVALGEADAAIVYLTDALRLSGVRLLEPPSELTPDVRYPIALLADAPHAEQASRFLAFVASDAGRSVLARHGFTLPPLEQP